MINRRQALIAVASTIGFLNGTPAQAQRKLLLPLDGIDAITIIYRGQQIDIPPQDVIDAIRPARGYK